MWMPLIRHTKRWTREDKQDTILKSFKLLFSLQETAYTSTSHHWYSRKAQKLAEQAYAVVQQHENSSPG